MSDLAAWHRLFPDDDAIGEDLLLRWSEPHRRYHTLDHLALMLRVIDEHPDQADDPDAVRLAAWFHDAIYLPLGSATDGSFSNEDASARLALDALGKLGVAGKRAEEVARLVRLTAGHAVADGDRNGGLLADADLAVLAGQPADYARYAQAVREEYAVVPDELFRPGRAQILQQLLDLPALFRVVPDRAAWAARARANLRAEIAALLAD